MPAPLPPHATPGNVLAGKYLLERVIGRGGMGVVLAAQHQALGKRVAVKLLLAEADQTTQARFQLEARAAALIQSPNVAQVLDFGLTDDGLAYLVMEYLEGIDLSAEQKRRRKLPVAEAVDIVLEASLGIAHAHAAGLVHRDIKPANIFLANVAGRRVIKVLDFGLIKFLDDSAALTNSTETFGTPKYMAPEQLRSARAVDERADQHALGAVLFQLITGRPPFDGDTIPEIILQVCTELAPHVWNVGLDAPPLLDESLQRALAKAPEQRFSSLTQFARAFAPFGTSRALELCAEIEACLDRSGRWSRSVEPSTTLERARPMVSAAPDPSVKPRGSDSITGARLAASTWSATATPDPTVSATHGFHVEPTLPLPSSGTLSAGSLTSARGAAAELPRKNSSAKALAVVALLGAVLAAALTIFAVESGRLKLSSRGPSASETAPVSVGAPGFRDVSKEPSIAVTAATQTSAPPLQSNTPAPASSSKSASDVAVSTPAKSNLTGPKQPGSRLAGSEAHPTAAPPATSPSAPRRCTGLDCL